MMTAISVGIIGVFLDAFSYFNEVWMDDGTYSHGYFSLAMVAFVLYSQRKKLPVPNATPNPLFIVCILVTLVTAYSTNYYGQDFVFRCLFLLSVVYFIRIWYSKAESVEFIIPVLILAFALPIWGLSIPALQYLATTIVGFFVGLSGLEVMTDGFLISIPNGTFKIANGCSGLRYLLVGATMAVFYWFMYFKSPKSFVKLLAFNLLLSLITNWVRIGYLVYVGHVSEMNDPLMSDHNMLGWYMFFVPVVLTFLYGRLLENKETNY